MRTPEDRIKIAQMRCLESAAGILAILFIVLVVSVIAGAFWLLAGFWGR